MFKKTVLAAALAAAGGLAHAGNPLVKDIFTADPSALVDGNRVYLYVGRDEAPVEGKDYLMREWRVLSSCDMKNWTDHGVPLNVKTFKWAKADAWAADVTKRNGKYYFYAPVEHDATKPGKAIGVAVSDKPTGPFVDARGSALVTNDMTKETDIPWDDIDPAVFIDKDGQAYLYWGNRVLKYAKLKPNMIELDGPIHTVGIDNFTEPTT
jgi:beta-xylosidase